MRLCYLRNRWRLWLFWAAAAGILYGVFALYRLPVEAAVYTSLLCLPMGLWLLWGDYRRFCRLYRSLAELASQVRGGTVPQVPPPPPGAEPLETAVWETLSALCRDRLETDARQRRQNAQLTDHLALWVHQIKTPLSALSLLTQEQEAPSPEVQAELLKVEQYVELLLTYLRLGFDGTDYLLRRCALDDLIRGAVRKFAPLFILKKISLDFTPTGCTVLTDEKWLAVVMEQLLSNALKYTPSGGVVRIRGEGETLFIADTGIGIRPEDQKRIFEAGFTGCNGRLEKTSTGIGLYLCRRITDGLGHRLTLTSRPGEGTCAALDLSRHEAAAE